MIYIITALKAEAQAFVDFYKLKKSKLETLTLFTNKDIKLIISGIGAAKARNATQMFINHFDISDDDTYVNVGICAADIRYKIGELIEIGTITYEGKSHTFKKNKAEITCLDTEANTMTRQIVDMESFGVLDAVTHSPAIKNFYIFKIVSDHFQPHLVTKERTKRLLFNAINEIHTIIQN